MVMLSDNSNFTCARQVTLILGLIAVASPAKSNDSIVDFELPEFKEVLIIPLTVANKERLFLLDTGASTMFLHETLRPALGKSIANYPVNGALGREQREDFFNAPVGKIRDHSWQCPLEVGCASLTPFREATGRDLEGILGIPFFQDNVVQLDFDNRRIRVLQPDTTPDKDWGAAVAVTFTDTGLPTINVELPDGKHERCVVDSGYTGAISLSWEVYLRISTAQFITPKKSGMLATMSGLHTVPQGRISTIALADHSHSDLTAESSTSAWSRIGLGYLRRFRVTFDLKRKTIYFASGKDYAEPERHDSPGLGFIRKGEDTVLAGLQKDTPAERAGLLLGDHLISIAEQPVKGLPIAQIGWMFSNAAKAADVVPLRIKRSETVHTISVRIPPIKDKVTSNGYPKPGTSQ